MAESVDKDRARIVLLSVIEEDTLNVVIVGANPSDIVMSTLTLNLNEPNKFLEIIVPREKNIYDKASVFIKNTIPNNYTIYAIRGYKDYIEDFDACIKQRDTIAKIITGMFTDLKNTSGKTKNISKTIKITPACIAYSRIRGDTGRPLSPSIMKNNSCPPSKIGIGTKLIIPKDIDIRAIKRAHSNNPFSAALLA